MIWPQTEMIAVAVELEDAALNTEVAGWVAIENESELDREE